MIDSGRNRRLTLIALLFSFLGLLTSASPGLAEAQDRIILHDGRQLQGRMLLEQVRLETAIGAFVFDRSAISEIHCPEDADRPVTLHTHRGDRLTGFLEPWHLQVEAENSVTPIQRDAVKQILLAGALEAKADDSGDQRIILRNGDRLQGRLQGTALEFGDDTITVSAPTQVDLGEAANGAPVAVISSGSKSPHIELRPLDGVRFRHWSGADIRVSRERLASIESDAGERLAFRDSLADGSPCVDCPMMQVIPPGDYLMGSPNAVDMNRPNEGPVHPVSIAYPFALGVHEITFDQWDACRADGACQNRGADEHFGRGARPAISLSVDDAKQFLAWLSNRTGHAYRLPSEAEWEYAARAGTTTLYYWGDEIGKLNAACENCGSKWDNKRSAPTGSFPPNPFGLHDILGNAWEWTADCWNESYEGAPSDGSAWQDGDCSGHVMRGGAWFSFPVNLRTTTRFRGVVDNRYLSKGLRVARDF